MDEQAGPGVFFSGGSGSGSVRVPQSGDGDAARAQYNIPGILHFLRHEWARFEVERNQWEVERAELQVSPRFGSARLGSVRMLNDPAAVVVVCVGGSGLRVCWEQVDLRDYVTVLPEGQKPSETTGRGEVPLSDSGWCPIMGTQAGLADSGLIRTGSAP